MTETTIVAPCGCSYTEEEIKALWAKYTGLRGGRPREPDRCPCGLMGKSRALARGHKCTKPKKPKPR